MKTKNIAVWALFLLIAGYGYDAAFGQENNPPAEKNKIDIVKGEVEFLIPEGVTVDQKAVEDEFAAFLKDLTEEKKKSDDSIIPRCSYTITVNLRVKPKWRSVAITVKPATGKVYQFFDKYLAKNQQNEKSYQEYVSGLAKKVLGYINASE